MFDSTYKSNSYGRPLLNLVGSTSINTTIQVSITLIDSQKEEDFVQCLSNVKTSFKKHDIQLPRVLITNRDKVTINAINRVFPLIPYIICRQHFKKDVLAYARKQGKDQSVIIAPIEADANNKDDLDKTIEFQQLFQLTI